MEKIWLKNYDANVPTIISPMQYSSIVALAEECFGKFSSSACYSNLGVILTYQHVDKLSRSFAGFLQTVCQLVPGERVVIMLPNILQYPVVLFGALRAGLVVVNANPFYTPRELHHLLSDSQASCVIVLENFAHVLERALPESYVKHVIVTKIGDLLGKIKGGIINFTVKHFKKMILPWHIPFSHEFINTLDMTYQQVFKPVAIKGEDIAFLQYTGGTTGIAKGAILTHRNIIANTLQAGVWIEYAVQGAISRNIITALPLYHIFSLLANCFVCLHLGFCNILITNPRDIAGFIKILKRQPFSLITGVNTLFSALLNHPEFTQINFKSLKFALGGGMALQKAVAEKWHAVTGVVLLQAYGLTETSPGVAINPLSITFYNGSVGLPLPSTEVKICDEEGKEVPLGVAGELLVRGPQVMQGYWRQPQETKLVLDEKGWLRTGDIATINEEGFLYIVDRKKDIIIISGFNVYPNEVEAVIAAMPQVKEVAVIGIPCKQHGEAVKALIVKKDPTLTQEEVLQHCQQQLTNYKIPSEIEFRLELPKSNVGKVLRRALREEERKRANVHI